MSRARKFLKNLKFDIVGKKSQKREDERIAELRAAKNSLDESKRIELEDHFKSSLDYVVLKSASFDDAINNKRFIRELHRLSEIINIEGKYNPQIRTIISYNKVVEAFINLMDSSLECSKKFLVEHRATKADQNSKFHRDHSQDFCKEANHVFYSVVYLIASATHTSVLFRKKFNEMGGAQLLLYYISSEDFLSKCIMAVESDPDENYHILFLMRNVINTIRNLSNSIEFDNFKVRLILIAFVKAFKFQESHLLLAHLLLIKISTESEFEATPNKNVFCQRFVQLTGMCVEAIERTDALERVEIELDYGRVTTVCQIASDNCDFNLIELLDTLNHLCVNDKIKYEFFVDNNLNDLIRRIILHGNDSEIEYAVKLLIQLSFDKSVKQILNDDLNLVTMVRKIFSYQYPNKRLVKYSEAFVWMLDNDFSSNVVGSLKAHQFRKSYNRESRERSTSSSKSHGSTRLSSQLAEAPPATSSEKAVEKADISEKTSTTIHKNQVFMSFESLSRQLCLRVKNDLKMFDFNVWMNDEKFNNFDFMTTLEAIKRSECVILCKIQLSLLILKFYHF